MIQYTENKRYKILTSKGFKSFKGIRKTTRDEVLCIRLEDDSIIKCSEDHKFFIGKTVVLAKTLKVGDSFSNNLRISSVKLEKYSEFLYDPVEVEDGSEYLSDNGISSHNCDFATSGNTVIEPEILNWYQLNTVREPKEKSELNQAYWVWDYPDPMKTYLVVADVARGGSQDYSAFHVMEIETMVQVAEFRNQISTKEFARRLVSEGIKWNSALLVVENANVGWDVVTTIQEIGYSNLYYSPKSELVGTQIDLYVAKYDSGDGMVPGFGTNQKTRPLLINKARSFIEEKVVVIRSQRLLDELRVFIWKGKTDGDVRAQAMQGYNDDLTMAWFIGLFLRDTAIRFRQTAMDLTYATLNGYTRTQGDFQIYNTAPNINQQHPWQMNINGEAEDIGWLIG